MGETSLLYYTYSKTLVKTVHVHLVFIQIWLHVHVDATGENLIQDKIF